ncbi:S6e family ribosomal protein [Nanoarchaeota archaeon]
MAEFKLVLNDPKKGKSKQLEVKEDNAKAFIGLKIGNKVKGEAFDLPGYEFEITGGSDAAGFPMRKDITGPARKRILAVKGVGITNKLRKPNPKKKGWRTIKGMRQKKTVAGNQIHEKTAQINLKILKEGSEKLFEEAKAAPKEEAKPKEEKKEEAPKAKEEPKKEPEKKEEVKEEKKEEAPKEEKKKETSETQSVSDGDQKAKLSDKADDELEEIKKKVEKDEEDIKKLDEEEKKIEEELKKE